MSVVYFISDGKFVKIGCTKNLDHRLYLLQTYNPKKLFVLESFIGGYNEEKVAHNYFANFNVKGEWYNINKDQVVDFVSIIDNFRFSDSSKIKLENFTLLDHKLWDFILSSKEKHFNITYKDVEHIMSIRGYYRAKKKLLKFNFIRLISKKRYSVNNKMC